MFVVAIASSLMKTGHDTGWDSSPTKMPHVLVPVGSDANYKKVASQFKISHGLVQIFVELCTRALISTFQSDVISWPDATERKIISKDSKKNMALLTVWV